MNGENPQPIGTYREKSPYAKRAFSLYANKVTIQGKNRQGEFVHHIPLEQIAPDIGSRSLPNPNVRYLLFSFGWLIAALAIVLVLLGGNSEPRAVVIIAIVVALLTANFVALLWMRGRRFPAYTFFNTQGTLVLDMIEAGPEKANCQAFAELVSQTIKNLRGL